MKVVVVGAGLGGIGVAVELARHGYRDVTVLEGALELGGTWYQNSYPGCACDVPSHLYSYSFAPRTDWPRNCSRQREILRYLNEVARDCGVDQSVVVGTHVESCSWNDETRKWTVVARDGRAWTADAVVLATGQLHQPAYPDIPGSEGFGGHAFHSSRWDHSYDLVGKRVGVIGTGASAVQFVPVLADRVARLELFQRSPNWFLPRRHYEYPEGFKRILARFPTLQGARRGCLSCSVEVVTALIRHERAARLLGERLSWAFMKRQVPDPEIRRKIRPDYAWGCKRILFTSDFLPTLTRSNVSLVTERIVSMEERGVRTVDGMIHELDCVVYATGFQTSQFFLPMKVTGRKGVRMEDGWKDGPRAYLGVCVPGFPSLFLVYGPNTNTSSGSIIAFEEAQASYVRQALQAVRSRGAAAIEVKPEVEAAYNRWLQARFQGTAWATCQSWYRDASGRFVANWPGYMVGYRRRLRSLDPSEFVFHPPD